MKTIKAGSTRKAKEVNLEEAQKAKVTLSEEDFNKIFDAYWNSYSLLSLVSNELEQLEPNSEEAGHCNVAVKLALHNLKTIGGLVID